MEGQGDRARGDRLRNGEVPFAETEALSVERLQVDRHEVITAFDAGGSQARKDRVALGPGDSVREPDDVCEPGDPLPGPRWVGESDSGDSSEPPAISAEEALAGGDGSLDAGELGGSQGAEDVGKPVVVSQPLVLHPSRGPRTGPALISQAPA